MSCPRMHEIGSYSIDHTTRIFLMVPNYWPLDIQDRRRIKPNRIFVLIGFITAVPVSLILLIVLDIEAIRMSR